MFQSPVTISNASTITLRGGTAGKTIHGNDYLESVYNVDTL